MKRIKLDNRGFAITSIIYSMLLLAIVLMTITIATLGRKQVALNNSKNKIYNQFNSFYTVNYNCNDDGNSSMESSTFNLNTWKTLSKNTCTYGTLKFKGWSLTSDGEVSYPDQARVYNLADKDEVINLYALWEKESETKLCIRAKSLHTETCSQTDTFVYCRADGYSQGATITYGNLGTSGTLATGDAFDCDVDGDGDYNSETERFYYVSDLNNGITTNSDVAVLVYYNNVLNGDPSNSKAYAYDSSNKNNNGPVTAIAQLPTIEQWKNVSLTSTTRQITNENGKTETIAGNLPNFSYEGKAARLLTYQEVNAGCYDGTTAINLTGGLSSKCQFLMENTKYSNSSLNTYGGWLESPDSSFSSAVWSVRGNNRGLNNSSADTSSDYGFRPVIEVLKSNISY